MPFSMPPLSFQRINGVYAGAGTTSDTTVHFETSHSDLLCKADAYEGGLCDLCVHPYSIDKTEITDLYQKGIPAPAYTPFIQRCGVLS